MRTLRNAITFLVLLLGTAISVAAAVQVARQKFPQPVVTENLDFTDWIIDRDLSQENEATSRMLAQRMDVELRAGKWSGRVKNRELTGEQRALVQRNLLLVLEQYFYEKMDRYFQRPKEHRSEYLDREIDTLLKLLEKNVPQQLKPADLPLPGVLAAIGVVNAKIGEWVDNADPEAQPRMREFHAALVERFQHRFTEQFLEKH